MEIQRATPHKLLAETKFENTALNENFQTKFKIAVLEPVKCVQNCVVRETIPSSNDLELILGVDT